MKIKIVAFLLLLCCSVLWCGESFQLKSEIFWDSGIIRLTVTTDATGYGPVVPLAMSAAEEAIENNLLDLFTSAVTSIRVDSRHTIGDILNSDVSLISSLERIAGSGIKISSNLSRDFAYLVAVYEYSLFPDIISVFDENSTPVAVDPRLDYTPTRAFSGILIYAAEALPLHGESETGRLQPALFPRVFDEDLNPVLNSSNLHRTVLHAGGVMHYGYGLNRNLFAADIGEDPLIIDAQAIFGVNHTDIILSREDAGRILYSAHNRKLLETGKVTVILPPVE